MNRLYIFSVVLGSSLIMAVYGMGMGSLGMGNMGMYGSSMGMMKGGMYPYMMSPMMSYTGGGNSMGGIWSFLVFIIILIIIASIFDFGGTFNGH